MIRINSALLNEETMTSVGVCEREMGRAGKLLIKNAEKFQQIRYGVCDNVYSCLKSYSFTMRSEKLTKENGKFVWFGTTTQHLFIAHIPRIYSVISILRR